MVFLQVFMKSQYDGWSRSVSNPGFPAPDTRFFSTTKPGYKKNWNCCCIQKLAILIAHEVLEWRV